MKRTESNTISRTLLCGFPHLKGISSHKIQFSIIFPRFIFFRSFVLYSLQFVLILLLYFFFSFLSLFCVARAKVSQLHSQRIYKHIPYETANLYFSCSRNIVSRLHSLPRKLSPAPVFFLLKNALCIFQVLHVFMAFRQKKGKNYKFVERFFILVHFQCVILKRLSNPLSCGQWTNKEPHSLMEIT